MFIGIIIALSIVIIILLVLWLSLRHSIREITEEMEEKMSMDTNTLISLSSADPCICGFADSLNKQLTLLKDERRRFQKGDAELKAAVTNISHDIRTPLTAICSYLDLLDETEKSDTVARYIEIIKGRAEVLKQLTEELFRYSVIISPDKEVKLEEVVVNTVIEESVAGFYAALKEKDIVPDIRIADKKIVRNLDKSALSRILSNVMNNALKYSDGDLNIELTDKGEIIFSNNASQLNEVQVGRLFDRFYTVEASRKSTGLGLTIARTLVEKMHGTITAKYENKRLYICIYFPKI